MELTVPSEVISGLKRAGNSTLVNDDVFTKLLQASRNTITQSDLSDISSSLFSSSKGDLLKDAHYALSSLCVEASRIDLPPESLSCFLETKVNWSKSRSDKLCEVYSSSLSKIQAHLSSVGIHPPHITDVTWCLSHNIKSNTQENISNSIVAIKLDTEGSTSNQEQNQVKFVCSLPELQDLVSKLKDALRHIEHVAQMNHV